MDDRARPRRRWPKQITEKQFKFAAEFLDVFKSSIENLAANKPEDTFDEYLSIWAVNLGVLAHDVFRSVTLLLKQGEVRTAYMLSRPLLDYHIRLRYYVIQSREPKEKWIANNRRSIKNYLKRTDAYKDWNNAREKIFSILAKRSQQEWGDIASDDRARIEATLKAEKEVFSRRIDYMLEIAQPEKRGDYYSHHQLQSAFLHGDQVTAVNTMEKQTVDGEETLELHWNDKKFSPRITLGDSYLWCYEILASIEMFRGWAYGKDYSFRQAYFAFMLDDEQG